jgi:DNA-binding response OmpR family regulator
MGLIPPRCIIHIADEKSPLRLYNSEEFVASCEENDISLKECSSLEDLKYILYDYRPEIILVSENMYESGFDFKTINEKQRSKNDAYKLILLPAKARENKKNFDYIKEGFDDFIFNDYSLEEIFLKCFSLLRRKSIHEKNQLTKLPGINRTYEVLEYCLSDLKDWEMLHITTHNLDQYSYMYGVKNTDEVIKLTASLLAELTKDKNLFTGHLGKDNFLVLGSISDLVDIKPKIDQRFSTILEQVYNKNDFENNYIIYSAPHKVRRKENLMSLNISNCTSYDRKFLSGSDIVEQAIINKHNQSQNLINKRVLIIEDDADFAELLEDRLRIDGFEPKIAKDEIIQSAKKFNPRVVLIEASTKGIPQFIDLAKALRNNCDSDLKIIVASNIPGYRNFLAAGANAYIPKPYELDTVIEEISRIS